MSYFSPSYGQNIQDCHCSSNYISKLYSDNVRVCTNQYSNCGHRKCYKFSNGWFSDCDWNVGICSFFRHQAEQNHYNAEQEEKRRNQPNLSVVYAPNISRDTYSPARSYTTQNGALIRRTFLRIAIENTGGGLAEHCDAKIRVPQEMVIPGTSPPSYEPKILLWDTEQRYEDIGANNFAVLNVVFSHDPAIRDGRDNRILKNAFIATPHNITTTNILSPRIEDGFGVGRFRFEVVVRAKSGHSVSAIFRLDVNANWDVITMELVT